MTFTRAELESYAGRTIPDLVGDDLLLLFVGINPGLVSAATGLHFARNGNRFYPALRLAGILPPDVMTPAAAAPELVRRGVGITNIVARASARADELEPAELLAGRARLEALVAKHRPRVVAVAGITAYRTAFGRRAAGLGRQEERIGDAELWVVPNPSGLNAHETPESLARAYRMAAEAAGIELFS
jgi:TDG/mug DNA glycosylase family protein